MPGKSRKEDNMLGPRHIRIRSWGSHGFCFPMGADIVKDLQRHGLIESAHATLSGTPATVNINKSDGEILFVISIPARVRRGY